MALPDKGSEAPSTPKAPSYSDIAKRSIPTKTSLMNPAAQDSNNDASAQISNDLAVRVIKSTIWRHARVAQGYFLDISKITNVTEQQHLEHLADQYGGATNFNGIKFMGKNKERYLEVSPAPEIIPSFTANGVYYGDQKLRLLPCQALEGDGDVVHLNLTEIPPLGKAQIQLELHTALSKLGHVMDFGLKFEASRGFFAGLGYAVIHRPKSSSFKKLEHTISLEGSNEFCYATFPDMPLWCRYCHSEGHTKYECPKSKARILCYSCDKYGHMAKDCPSPQKKSGPKFKKPRKVGKGSAAAEDAATEAQPSEELLKSKCAPAESTPQDPHSQADEPQPTTHNSEEASVLAGNSYKVLAENANIEVGDGSEDDDQDYVPTESEEGSDTESEMDDREEVGEHELDKLMEEANECKGDVNNVTEATAVPTTPKLRTFVSQDANKTQAIDQTDLSLQTKN